MLGMLQLAHGVPEDTQETIDPKSRIRRREHDQTARLEHAIHFGHQYFRRGHVLDDLRAENQIELGVGVVQPVLDVSDPPFEAIFAIALDGRLREVDPLHAMSFGRQRDRIDTRPATDVENVEIAARRYAIDRILLAGPGNLAPFGIFSIVKRLDSLVHGAGPPPTTSL